MKVKAKDNEIVVASFQMRPFKREKVQNVTRMGIDPGNEYSAYVIKQDGKIKEFAKLHNSDVAGTLDAWVFHADGPKMLVIERIQAMGMPSGKTVFETCEWVGRFSQIAEQNGVPVGYVYRNQEKMALCGSMKAKDANIRQALIDRYATFDFKTGKGTKKNPDTLYGFHTDCWSALAVVTTWEDMQKVSAP